MKIRFVAVLAAILIVIGMIVTCVDYAKTITSSNKKEGESTTISTVQPGGETPTTGETQGAETPETDATGEPQGTEAPTIKPTEQPQATEKPETTQKPQGTEKPQPETTQPPQETEDPSTGTTGGAEDSEEPEVNDSKYFGKDITFTSEYICKEGYMPYALYTPSSIDRSEKTPLIVWLHGSGEVGVGKDTFFNSGLLKTLNKWRRQGFNAYVICPQLAGNYNTGRWNKDTTRDNLKALLDMFIEEYNIDTDKIIVVGHSLGGQGALYMAYELPEYFSRCVVLSGYNPGIDISGIKVPTLGFVGTENAGEDTGSISYMKKYFMEVFGGDNTFFIETSHGGVPNAAFSIDTDDDDRSDLVEWMFGEFEFK